jgi:hypothetical protein
MNEEALTKEEFAEKWVGHDFHDGLNEEFLSDLNALLREERLKVIDEVLATYVRDGNPEVWRDQITKFKSQQQ